MREESQAAQETPPQTSGTEGSPEERRCGTCGMKLSNYNPGPNCWQHTIGYPWRGPTAKPKF
jgi:hypothetical protein